MGWRVRHVQVLDPIERDLTVHHPLLSLDYKSVLHSILKDHSSSPTIPTSTKKWKCMGDNHVDKLNDCHSKREAQYNERPINSNKQQSEYDNSWVEVLCLKGELKASPYLLSDKKSRWIHVDPHHELFNDPLRVESSRRFYAATSARKNKICKTMKPFSYVISVENFNEYMEDITMEFRAEDNISCSFHSSCSPKVRLTDVTPRYSNKWSTSLGLRGATSKEIVTSRGRCPNVWWAETIQKANRFFKKQRRKNTQTKKKTSANITDANNCFKGINHSHDERKTPSESSRQALPHHEDISQAEQDELASSIQNEPIPKSKTAFKNHPMFVIPSALKRQEVLAPDSCKRTCGIFKGEMVYKRTDVYKAMEQKKWLYEGRKVRDAEISKPVKIVKARRKPVKKGFQMISSYGISKSDQADAINSSTVHRVEDNLTSLLYGIWQTAEWSPPPIEPDDSIPVNEHNNIELALLNPGLVHLKLHRIATIAKKLGVPYAPCLIGFEGHGGNRTPTIRGIVVHQQNVDLLCEAHLELESQTIEIEYKEHQESIHERWRVLVQGIMTKERLEGKYRKD